MASGPKRNDPRAEPDFEPEKDGRQAEDPASAGSIRLHDDQVSLPSGRPPMNALKSGAEVPVAAEIEIIESRGGDAAAHGSEPKKRPVTGRGVTNVDPRLAEIEPLIGQGDWAAVAKRLGPFDNAGALPPQLGVMYAIAVNEAPAAAEGEDATALAMRCVAAMCGVSETSGFALVIAKRLLRKNPTSFRAKQAPPAKTSFFIILVVLLLGSAIGYVLSSGKIRLPH